MKIGVIGSMQFSEEMLGICKLLKELGHEAFTTSLVDEFLGKSDEEKEEIKLRQKKEIDVYNEFWDLMQGGDAVLVLNLEKNGIENYIGANTLMEMGFAKVLGQKIFLYNPIPDMPYIRTEVEAVRPIVLNGNLSKI